MMRALFFAVASTLLLPVQAQQICQRDSTQATAPASRFVAHGDDGVHDLQSNLIWRRCLEGQSGDRCEAGRPHGFTWLEALKLAMPDDGWRLPNIRELETLVELQCSRPAIDATLFPTPASAKLWSSSPYRFYSHYAWFLHFEDGVFVYGDRTDRLHVRLVRSKNP